MTKFRFNTGPEKEQAVDIGFCFDIFDETRKAAVEQARALFKDASFHLEHTDGEGNSIDVSFYVNDLEVTEDDIVDEEEVRDPLDLP